MRSLVAAFVVLGLAAALLARSVSAGPPMAMPARDLQEAIASFQKQPGAKTSLASARFLAEVFGARTLEGQDQTGLFGAEAAISQRSCGALTPVERKAANALLKEFGDVLPVTLRAYTLGQLGKTKESADLFATFIDQQLPAGPDCPSEHPAVGGMRTWRMDLALQCVRVIAPARDVSKQVRQLERARKCVQTDNAVG